MLSSISWAGYFTAIAILLVVYYTVIGYRFYRQDVLSVTGGLNNRQSLSSVADQLRQETILQKDEEGEATTNNTPLLVEYFTDEVQAFFQEAKNNELDKATILHSLQIIVSKYPSLRTSEYKSLLEQLIIDETELNCAVLIKEDEVRRVWNEDQA